MIDCHIHNYSKWKPATYILWFKLLFKHSFIWLNIKLWVYSISRTACFTRRIISYSKGYSWVSTKQWVSLLADILVFTLQAVDWCPAQAIIIITVPHCPCVTGAVVRALLIKIPGVPSPCYAVCDISHWDAAASCQVSQQNLLTQHTQARFIFNNKVFAFDPGIKWLVTVNMWFISLKYQVITIRSTLYKGLVSCESSLLVIRFTFKILFLHHFSTLHG